MMWVHDQQRVIGVGPVDGHAKFGSRHASQLVNA
jgi:hypothetical protein